MESPSPRTSHIVIPTAASRIPVFQQIFSVVWLFLAVSPIRLGPFLAQLLGIQDRNVKLILAWGLFLIVVQIPSACYWLIFRKFSTFPLRKAPLIFPGIGIILSSPGLLVLDDLRIPWFLGNLLFSGSLGFGVRYLGRRMLLRDTSQDELNEIIARSVAEIHSETMVKSARPLSAANSVLPDFREVIDYNVRTALSERARTYVPGLCFTVLLFYLYLLPADIFSFLAIMCLGALFTGVCMLVSIPFIKRSATQNYPVSIYYHNGCLHFETPSRAGQIVLVDSSWQDGNLTHGLPVADRVWMPCLVVKSKPTNWLEKVFGNQDSYPCGMTTESYLQWRVALTFHGAEKPWPAS